MPKYLFFLEELQKAWQETKNLSCVAARFNLYRSDVKKALSLKPRQALPIQYVPTYATEVKRSGSKYMTRGQEVVLLRDERFITFPKIAEQLKIGLGTALRAYARAKSNAPKDNKKNDPLLPVRGSTNLPYWMFEKIDALAEKGVKFKKIAEEVGCGPTTAYRRMLQLKEQGQIRNNCLITINS